MLDEYKLAVAIGDFEGAPDDVQTYLRGLLESRLRGGAMERFEVLDRNGLEAVLLEQQIATSELADPRFATRLGKLRDSPPGHQHGDRPHRRGLRHFRAELERRRRA